MNERRGLGRSAWREGVAGRQAGKGRLRLRPYSEGSGLLFLILLSKKENGRPVPAGAKLVPT